MRNRPDRAGKPAWARGWAAVACVVLLAGSATALRGQTPGTAKTDGQAAQNSTAPGAQTAQPAMAQAGVPAQTDTRPADTKPADTKPAETKAAGGKAAPGQAAVPGTATPGTATPGTAAAGGDAQSSQVEQQAADLLKLATDLVNEINETRPATLSVAVVRKTDAIEQLAKKMKGQP